MGHWAFVFLAYGIVWTAILGYLLSLKVRLKNVQAELDLLETSEGNAGPASRHEASEAVKA